MFKINRDYSNANIPRTIRFTESIFNDLSKACEKAQISFNLLVLQCCRYALEHMEPEEEGRKEKNNPAVK